MVGLLYQLMFCGSLYDNAPTLATVDSAVLSDVGQFAPIIGAYAVLEQGGYSTFDKETIGNSVLTYGSTYNFGQQVGWDNNLIFMYSLYDINGDSVPELIFGVKIVNENIYLSGIYALQNNNPVSIIEVESRSYLHVITDIEGNVVISHARGRMDYAQDAYYQIDQNGKLVTLDILNTNGFDWSKANPDNPEEAPPYIRTKEINGQEIIISEDEYSTLIKKYGTSGYGLSNGDDWVAAERPINLNWKPILSSK